MPTQTDINTGMSLDEILASDAPADVFAALKDDTINKLDDSLNKRVPGGISELMERLLDPKETTQIIADALIAELASFTADIDGVIGADLSVQDNLRKDREAIDLTSVILPQEVLQPELLEIVTTDQLKEVIRTYAADELNKDVDLKDE